MRREAGPLIRLLSAAGGASSRAQGGACGCPGGVALGTLGVGGQRPPMDGPEAPGPRRDATCGEGARDTRTEGRPAPEEASGPSCSLGSGPQTPLPPASPPPAFISSFSFIRLSLSSASERGEAEGCPPAREAKDTGARAASPDGHHQDPGCLSPRFGLKAARGPADSAWTRTGGPRLEGEPLSVLDTDAASSCSLDPPGCEGTASRWDPLLRKCEPLLQGCLLSHRRRLEVNALRLKLQKLQEKAVEEEDYDKAETFKHKLDNLEEEEEEESSLCFQLPSRQPALCSLLVHLGAQAEAALHRAAEQAGGEDTQAPLCMVPPADGPPCASVTRRDRLLHEKQQLQEEMEALQARMSVLAAKDQQLRREMELQQQLLRWRDCDLRPLLEGLTPGELQEVHQAARDTLALAGQSPLPAGPPEAVRSLQERLKPLHWSLREIAAKVCRTQRLCGSLRRSLHEIETQLPALLEAKMLAVSGNHFSTAKELAEEIGALTMERDGLEGLLARLAGLSARNVAALGGVQADYSRLQRELDRGKAAHEASVKEEAERYMDALEGKLRSCLCPLLGRVWEADVEACRLLIQSLQPPEPRGSPSAEDEPQLGDLAGDGRTAAPGSGPGPPAAEDGSRTPLQASEEWKAPPAPSPHRAASEQREGPHTLSAELGEKCEAIGKKLLCLEDQLHAAMHSHDEVLIHILSVLVDEPPASLIRTTDAQKSLRSELRLVKETLQAMILQLQPPREAGESEAASWATAGVREAQA
ncbi:disrupted in schizophrenia 1 protein [Myotis myotis]|uniref:disrupted in schizophrenia 1 protein n=1 Tax=Myotis myotis TaxID=51298 RepID=UPI0017497A4D|nr:disrupted in schizophrenia 1 protein [Myotis myotis]